jgi:uncharacterized membrane protein YjfL (UPF0719 family)
MDSELKAKMRKDLIASRRDPWGGGLGWACLIVLLILVYTVPGLKDLFENNTWPKWAVGIFSLIVGVVVAQIVGANAALKINDYDEDTLRYYHDQLARTKMKNYIFWAVAAIVAALIIFR